MVTDVSEKLIAILKVKPVSLSEMFVTACNSVPCHKPKGYNPYPHHHGNLFIVIDNGYRMRNKYIRCVTTLIHGLSSGEIVGYNG